MKRLSKELRMLIGLAFILYIVYIWAKKDIISIYSSMPKEQALPLIVTTLTVSLGKVAVLSIVILCIKWLLSKLGKK